MSDEEQLNPGHTAIRRVLRVLGPLILAAGVILMIIGMVSFFSAFGGGGPPRYFWCCFLGMPLIMVGGVMCQFGFMGAVFRYQAGEIAPVGKDTFNYMADGTKGGVKTVASAIGAGLSEGAGGATVECAHCGHVNDDDAKFCDECGTAMSKSCQSCGKVNDGDAKFCDSCGNQLPA